MILAGDSGQLPSVAAGGWFAEIAGLLDGPELREVLRQRDPAEREALAAIHDGDPEPYLQFKRERGDLEVHEREVDALAAILAEWNQARRHGLAQAVMIARDNTTRSILNEHARDLLIRDGAIAGDAVTSAGMEYRVGDRVIARRNDRHRDIENGTLGSITHIDRRSGAITVLTDAGDERVLDTHYVAEHLDHGYALTGHGAHGATVEWAGVIGRPSEYTREWAYTSLSRARERTRVYVTAEASHAQREREQYAPPEPKRTADDALAIIIAAMRRRESEPLAAALAVPSENIEPDPQSKLAIATSCATSARPENAGVPLGPAREPDWQRARKTRDQASVRGFER